MNHIEYPANVLNELGFDETYLTPEQEHRFNSIVDEGTIEERDIFTRHYALNVSIKMIATDEKQDIIQIKDIIARTTNRIIKNQHYILTGEY